MAPTSPPHAGAYRVPAPLPQVGPPQRFADTPEDRRLVQTFGWLESTTFVAIAAIGIGVGLVLIEARIDPSIVVFVDAGGFVLLALAAALVVLFEVARRRKRVSLVLFDEGVGVYREGILATAFPSGQLQQYVLQGLNTYRQMLGLYFVAFLGILATPLGFAFEKTGVILIGVGLLVGACVAVVSTVYTRSKCRTFWVPGRRGGFERTLFGLRQLNDVAFSVRWFSVG